MTAKRNGDSQTSHGTRLIGWMVSYADDDMGVSHDIRQGRTLIGNEEDRSRCITVEAEDVSEPHLAISASRKHRVLVQDIFSERGSFLIRCGEAKETRISGPVEVQHGDWIRIGNDTRFQFCLIDGPNR